jgi:hypothetical protein
LFALVNQSLTRNKKAPEITFLLIIGLDFSVLSLVWMIYIGALLWKILRNSSKDLSDRHIYQQVGRLGAPRPPPQTHG